jgi:hypothetical protein
VQDLLPAQRIEITLTQTGATDRTIDISVTDPTGPA